MEAIGVCDSHFSRLELYNLERSKAKFTNKKFIKTTTLNYSPKSFPVFYKDNMWNKISDGIKLELKYIKQWLGMARNGHCKDLLSGNTYRFSNYKS